MNDLINPEDLVQQLDVVQVFEVGAKTAQPIQAAKAKGLYNNAHIPTAQYVNLIQDFCNLRTSLEYQHPNETEMLQSLHKFQVDWDKPIVIYDRENHIWAARLFWIFKAFGHQHVHVLHGGFQSWQQQNFSVSDQIKHPKTSLNAAQMKFDSTFFADIEEVKNVVEGRSNSQLLNVLRPDVFRGDELRYSRAGHIPDSIIIYCGSGITASGAALALRQAQTTSIKIYDGSMSEWSADPNLPLQMMV